MLPLLRQLDELAEAVEGDLPPAPGRPGTPELPRARHPTGARILAEIGDDRQRFADARELKAGSSVVGGAWNSARSTASTSADGVPGRAPEQGPVGTADRSTSPT